MLDWKKGGGGIVTVAQTVLPDVPWQNVAALMETIEEFGNSD